MTSNELPSKKCRESNERNWRRLVWAIQLDQQMTRSKLEAHLECVLSKNESQNLFLWKNYCE